MTRDEVLAAYRNGERDFSGVDLHGIDLSGTNLSRINLHGADLSGTDLRGINLREADLSGANLSGTNLSPLILPDKLKGFDGATCPCGTRRGACLELEVLRSAAGFYLGYQCPHCGPLSRETGYYSNKDIAKMELQIARSGDIPLNARIS